MLGSIFSTAITVGLGLSAVAVIVVKLVGFLKELQEAIVALLDALKPDKDGTVRITAKELATIKKEFLDIPISIKNIFKKK